MHYTINIENKVSLVYESFVLYFLHLDDKRVYLNQRDMDNILDYLKFRECHNLY